MLPTNQPACELVDMFSRFFNDKIANIHRDIGSSDGSDSFGDLLPHVSATMDTLPPVSSDELFNIIMASPSKSCGIDPLPTTLLMLLSHCGEYPCECKNKYSRQIRQKVANIRRMGLRMQFATNRNDR